MYDDVILIRSVFEDYIFFPQVLFEELFVEIS